MAEAFAAEAPDAQSRMSALAGIGKAPKTANVWGPDNRPFGGSMWGPTPGMPGTTPSGYKLDFGVPESPMPKDVYPDVFKTKEEASAALNDLLGTR